MTNEKVLLTFLKQKRKYSSFRRSFRKGLPKYALDKIDNSDVLVRKSIDYLFIWEETSEGHSYWNEIQDEWFSLCEHFNLEGTINLNKV